MVMAAGAEEDAADARGFSNKTKGTAARIRIMRKLNRFKGSSLSSRAWVLLYLFIRSETSKGPL